NIYIGGGTPTSLNEAQLERLLQKVEELFHPDETMEYTVEAGRPDTITREKLRLMKEYRVNRISINPQTMNDKTLMAVGRKHSVDDIRRVFREAREEGHENINMDLILGLPGENAEDVRNTMEEIMKLEPDNVTVHTLAVKRASRLREELDQHDMTTADTLEAMLDIAADYAEKMGMEPYYMYRQKNMVGNFENVGYCHPGKEGVYNVQIMEEKQTILAAGAGASTKTVDPETDRIERVFNVKSIEDYIGRIDEMIERKRTGLPQGGNV
ncbi:MAG: coproporphyrinogen dehydrogenase HemZ, partial [Anaerotignum sp.]|nr:coproporphyrinogen dehydrogenase HemZ [Anaerotignum sp.]